MKLNNLFLQNNPSFGNIQVLHIKDADDRSHNWSKLAVAAEPIVRDFFQKSGFTDAIEISPDFALGLNNAEQEKGKIAVKRTEAESKGKPFSIIRFANKFLVVSGKRDMNKLLDVWPEFIDRLVSMRVYPHRVFNERMAFLREFIKSNSVSEEILVNVGDRTAYVNPERDMIKDLNPQIEARSLGEDEIEIVKK